MCNSTQFHVWTCIIVIKGKCQLLAFVEWLSHWLISINNVYTHIIVTHIPSCLWSLPTYVYTSSNGITGLLCVNSKWWIAVLLFVVQYKEWRIVHVLLPIVKAFALVLCPNQVYYVKPKINSKYFIKCISARLWKPLGTVVNWPSNSFNCSFRKIMWHTQSIISNAFLSFLHELITKIYLSGGRKSTEAKKVIVEVCKNFFKITKI